MDSDRQVSAKQQEIVQRAYDRFYDGGFHATGVDTVMAETGISKRTLYKYFPSKEALIDAVLDHYSQAIAKALFEPVSRSGDGPRQQILACFDGRKRMLDDHPIRGCLGIKAAQEFAGKQEAIATHGKESAEFAEEWFVNACRNGRFAQPETIGKQLHTLFQGAVLLSQVYGNTSPFESARSAAMQLMTVAAHRPDEETS